MVHRKFKFLFRTRFQVTFHSFVYAEIGMHEAFETRFSNGKHSKNNFRLNVILVMPGFMFHIFWVSLGILFMIFGAMRARLEFHGFSRLPGGTPELSQCTSRMVKSFLPPPLVICFLWGAEEQYSYR